ncbi:hypothetical protein [Microbacterium sp. H6]|uniref:hypothetical protein n=1 Tax=Microbacterium sp. H6 TaxID=421122 RepID=UPI000DE48175|nr:hypothetical protein [Microbacterium sp. H6]RBO73540.1 hypothetical protein DSP71_05125 [Microbacterium sp. H6]
MIRVNGTPLNNPALGWVFRPASVPYSALEPLTDDLRVAGRDGLVATPATLSAPVWPLTVNTAPGAWESLLALFSARDLVLTDDTRPGLSTRARLKGASPDRVFTRNEWVDVTFLVELLDVYWRPTADTTAPVDLTAASVTLELFAGISGVVSDSMIRLKGAATGTRVTDASGAWLTLPNAASTEYVRFESKTGKCFLTTTDTWSGGTEISGLVDFGGPRGHFEITPVLGTADPSTRIAKLTITSATRAGAVLAVRGRSSRIF